MATTYTKAEVDALLATKFGATQADTFWLMVCGFLVFFMQCGFALLEAGTVRAKNTKNILLKNMLDACVGALIWWSVGFMIAVSVPRLVFARARRAPPQPLRARARARPALLVSPSARP